MLKSDLSARIGGYLSERLGESVEVEQLRRFPVGFSWTTYGVDVARSGQGSPRRSLILRIGPQDGLFAPYSAEPQVAILSALEGSAVPAPRPYWHADDCTILGAPFFFCERMQGRAPLPSPGSPDDPVASHRADLAQQFVAALACLHLLDWRSHPALHDWARGITPDNTAARQIEGCLADYRRWAIRDEPAILWAAHWLRRHAPVARRLSVVHGDYRIGNFLVDEGRITAVLDWEEVHIGDPLEDIGWAVLPQFSGGSGLVCRLIEESEFLDLYESIAGAPVDRGAVRYYSVLALLRLALVGVAAAHRIEIGGASDIRLAALASQVPSTLRQMQKRIEAP